MKHLVATYEVPFVSKLCKSETYIYVTGSGKTDQLAQAIIFAIYIPDDRAKNCLRIDVLSLHISRSMPELCALETRSCKTAVLRNAHSKIAKLGKVR